MNKHFSLLIFCFLFHCVIRCSAQSYDYQYRFSVRELKEDLKMLKDSLEVYHPALYRYTSREKLEAAFREAERKIDRPLTQAAFYSLVAPVVAMVGDIHTTIDVPDATFNYLVTQSRLFPFGIRIVRGHIYIASNNSADTSIPVGSRITKMNGRTTAFILQQLKNTFSDEGMNETLKIKRVEQRFAYQYHLVFGYCDTFKLEYTGSSKPKTVPAEPYDTMIRRWAANKGRYPGLKPLSLQPPYLRLSIDSNTAVLRIASFQNDVLQQSGEAFQPFVDSAFAVIRTKNVKQLVVDIRGNEGGESANASYLYSFFTDRTFRFLYAMDATAKTYVEDTARGVKYSAKNGLFRTVDTTTKHTQFFGLSWQLPAANAFHGQLFVLIDGLTSSAAPQFAALVKLNKRGVLIGETAPGSLYGGSGRGYSYFYLPHSGLLTMISRYRLYLADPADVKKDMNVVPDFASVRSMEDLLGGVDRDMERVQKLIKLSGNPRF